MNARGDVPTEVFVDVLQLMDEQTTAGATILLGVFEQTG